MFKFQMNEIVKDKVSDYQGVILGRTEYATGCRHYGVARLQVDKDGKISEWEWIDESRLIGLGKKLAAFKSEQEEAKNPSGPCANPPQW